MNLMIPPCSLEICNDSDYLLKEILNIRSNYEITDIRIIKNIQTKPSQALPSFILAHFTCTKPHPMTQNQYSNPLEISVIAGGPWQREPRIRHMVPRLRHPSQIWQWWIAKNCHRHLPWPIFGTLLEISTKICKSF